MVRAKSKREKDRERLRDWLSLIQFLRRRALNTALYDRELAESVYVSTTTYYPGAEVGDVLADSRGRGSFQRKL